MERIDTMENNVKVIGVEEPIKKLKRVCAYARVSSDKDAMLQSLSSQISHYNDLISHNKEWMFVGVYADEGISGTKDDRPEFIRMINDAQEGKIDMIISKSISRFGRNTETVIRTIRELNSIGVDVYFESQRMHTLSKDGEFMLTILASFYQEEARSVSENMKWRIKKEFEQGNLWGGVNNYGYKVEHKTYTIVPEQAEVVRRIFELYVGGKGMVAIANMLNRKGVKPLIKAKWCKNSVRNILTNISYTGDLILQKTYHENYMTKKTKFNKGELPQYYVEDHHEPIISHELFDKANEIIKKRASHYKLDKQTARKSYPFTHMIKCSCCGATYQHKTTKYNTYWICPTYNMQGRDKCKDSKQIVESKLYDAINVHFDWDEFKEKRFAQLVDHMVAKQGNIVELHMKNGNVEEIRWVDPKRSDSWTLDMREKARQKTNEINKIKGEKKQWEK